MNCFEARQEFSALWRKTLASERRGELLAHLKGCEKCDHAFRVFALTAPVLHGDADRHAPRVPAATICIGVARAVTAESMASDGSGGGNICVRDQRGVSFGAGAG